MSNNTHSFQATVLYSPSMSQHAIEIAEELNAKELPTFCADLWKLRNPSEMLLNANISVIKSIKCKIIIFFLSRDWQTNGECQQVARIAFTKYMEQSNMTSEKVHIFPVRFDELPSNNSFDEGYDYRQRHFWWDKLKDLNPIQSSNQRWKDVLQNRIMCVIPARKTERQAQIFQYENTEDVDYYPIDKQKKPKFQVTNDTPQAKPPDLVIDALVIIHYPSNLIFNITARSKHRRALKSLTNRDNYVSVYKSLGKYSILLSEGIPDYETLDEIEKKYHVRTVVWIGEGVDEIKRQHSKKLDDYEIEENGDMSMKMILALEKIKPDIVLVCMQFGADYVAKEIIQKELHHESCFEVVHINGSPFEKTVEKFLAFTIFPVLKSILSIGSTKTCVKQPNLLKGPILCGTDGNMKAMNRKEMLTDKFYRDCNRQWKGIATVSTIFSNTMEQETRDTCKFLYDKSLKDLILKLKDMDTLLDCKELIEQNIREHDSDKSTIIYFKSDQKDKNSDHGEQHDEYEYDYNSDIEDHSMQENESELDSVDYRSESSLSLHDHSVHSCFSTTSSLEYNQNDARALVFFLCNSLTENFSIIYHVDSKEAMSHTLSELEQSDSRAVVWIDSKTGNDDSLSVADISNFLSKEVKMKGAIICLITGVVCDHLKNVETKVVESSSNDDSMNGIHITYTDLCGFLKIQANASAVRKQNFFNTFFSKATLDQLEGALFYLKGTRKVVTRGDLIHVYRDTEDNVFVRISILSIKELKMLMQQIVYDQKQFLKKLLRNHKKLKPLKDDDIAVDLTSFFEVHDKLILKLDRETSEQRDAIEKCTKFKKVHITGPAGSGKTFVGMNCIVDCIKDSRTHKVLYVCETLPLALHVSRWVYHRTQAFVTNDDFLHQLFFYVIDDSDNGNMEAKEKEALLIEYLNYEWDGMDFLESESCDSEDEDKNCESKRTRYFQIIVDPECPTKIVPTARVEADLMQEKFDLVVLDEGQNMISGVIQKDNECKEFGKQEQDQYSYQKAHYLYARKEEIKNILQENLDSRLIVLSDKSQGLLNESSILGIDFQASHNLIAITRCSQAISLASLSYSLCKPSSYSCKHDCYGHKIQSNLFDSKAMSSMEEKYVEYARKTVDTIANIEKQFPNTNFNLRIGIFVPSKEFKEALEKVLIKVHETNGMKQVNVRSDFKQQLNSDYYIISAKEFAEYLTVECFNQEEETKEKLAGNNCFHHRSRRFIVLDTVQAFSGLEVMMALLLHSDGSLQMKRNEDGTVSSMVPDPAVRCRIYKGITRAHLGAYIINEIVENGLFEWLTTMSQSLPQDKFVGHVKERNKSYRKNIIVFDRMENHDYSKNESKQNCQSRPISFDDAKKNLVEFGYSTKDIIKNSSDGSGKLEQRITVLSEAFDTPTISISCPLKSDKESNDSEPLVISIPDKQSYDTQNNGKLIILTTPPISKKQSPSSEIVGKLKFQWRFYVPYVPLAKCNNPPDFQLAMLDENAIRCKSSEKLQGSSCFNGTTGTISQLYHRQNIFVDKIREGYKFVIQVKKLQRGRLEIRDFHFEINSTLVKKPFAHMSEPFQNPTFSMSSPSIHHTQSQKQPSSEKMLTTNQNDYELKQLDMSIPQQQHLFDRVNHAGEWVDLVASPIIKKVALLPTSPWIGATIQIQWSLDDQTLFPSKERAYFSRDPVDSFNKRPQLGFRLVLLDEKLNTMIASEKLYADSYSGSKSWNLCHKYSEILCKMRKGCKFVIQVMISSYYVGPLIISALHFSCDSALVEKPFVRPKFLPVQTPEAKLCDATWYGNVAKVRLLIIDHPDMNVNCPNADGETALHIASKHGHLEICQLLLQRKHININAVDAEEKTPLDWAILNDHKHVSQFLVKNNAKAFIDVRDKQKKKTTSGLN